MIASIGHVKKVMGELRAKKKFGQNFLIDANIVERIAKGACNEDLKTIEIGPGLGALTEMLLKYSKSVDAYEIDPDMYEILLRSIEDERLQVFLGDFLDQDLSGYKEKVNVCANLPYYITTPVLMYLLESGVEFASVTVMVQKEVADRITAKAGSAEYGAITAAVAYYGKAEKLFTVSPGSFLPAPKVESAVMRITTHTENPYGDCNRKLLFDMMKAAFEQRRKTLPNAISAVFSELSKEEITKIYQKLIALRKGDKTMIYGDFEVLNRKKNRFVYKRSTPEKAYIIDCNLGKDKVTVYDKTQGYKEIFSSNSDEKWLRSYGVRILVKQN